MATNKIEELLTLEEIERAEREYQNIYGCAPFSLSTWNPSDYYRNTYLLNQVILPPQDDFIDYIYYYELDASILAACSKRLTGAKDRELIITNSGTASIAVVTSVLAALGLRRVLMVCPTYFSALHNCLQKGLEVKELHMLHRNGSYELPKEDILRSLADADALWITNPVYNTSVYMEAADIEFLTKYVLPSTYVIADECFSLSGMELSRKILDHQHFIGIYDPLKQFLINGVKFSAIILPSEMENLFCQWADVVCGSLTSSAVQAIKFFLSSDASRLHQRLEETDFEIQERVRKAASQYPNVFLDNGVAGHMMMCYIPSLSAKHLNTFHNFLEFQRKTGTSIVPGTRFHFSEEDGFAFRINLTRYDPVGFIRALNRALTHLTEN